jgi:monoamine oxidase
MKTLRPASEGQLEVLKINSWGKNPLAKGAYFHLAPGQVYRFFPALRQPVGRIYWAGEHMGLKNNGVEAACESAAYAVEQILQRGG